MKTYWKMPVGLRSQYERELNLYKQHVEKSELQLAWRQLERAHILGQPWAVEHTHIHWLMLKFGFRIKDWHEILGQLPRLFVGGVKSFVGNSGWQHWRSKCSSLEVDGNSGRYKSDDGTLC